MFASLERLAGSSLAVDSAEVLKCQLPFHNASERWRGCRLLCYCFLLPAQRGL